MTDEIGFEPMLTLYSTPAFAISYVEGRQVISRDVDLHRM